MDTEKISKKKKRKKGRKKRKHQKLLLVIGAILAVFFAVISGAAWLVQSYLGKIDYQEKADRQQISVEEETEILKEAGLWEEETESGEDSPEEEISQLEMQMKEQAEDGRELLHSEDVMNILLIGCDSRQRNGRGRSDSIILLSVNQEYEEITMTSIMRDSFVSIPEHTSNRINAAYAFGGADLLLDTIQTNFKIQVEQYVAVDFYSFVDIVDVMGGVDLEVSDAEVSVMNKYITEMNELNGREYDYDRLESGGMLHLNGTQALAYARVRYVGNADFERTERQRKILTKIFEKAKNLSFSQMNDLLNIILPQIKTNMSKSDILTILLKAPVYLQYDLQSLRIPVEDSYKSMRIRKMAVLGIDLEKNFEALETHIYKK